MSSIFEYIEVFYNNTMRHSTIDYQSPNEYERLFYKKQKDFATSKHIGTLH